MKCTSGLNDFSKESDLNLNNFTLVCDLVDSNWLKYE